MKASIFLTRPQGKNEILAAGLAKQGYQSTLLPALSVFPIKDNQHPLPQPSDFQLVVFVSGLAVGFYLDVLCQQNPDFVWPAASHAATVGWASAQPLHDSGLFAPGQIIHPQACALAQDSEALWPLLAPLLPTLQRVLIVRGQRGREWLGAKLEQQGIHVQRHAMYDRAAAIWTAAQQQVVQHHLLGNWPAVFLLTSSESVDAICDAIQVLNLTSAFARSRFVVVHPRIADHLQQRLSVAGKLQPSMVKICSPTDSGILQALLASASTDTGS
ncbi:uroporphyrinogen-III synthase [Alcaligenaceae bacterium]|nr:uroporphyrinogen-III synthase [Alcaligenaceae bacterium]